MARTVLMTMTDTHNVDLVDLSRCGAKLGGIHLPAPGQEVLILTGRLEAFGTVVWRRQGKCGVAFDIGLSETAHAALQDECRKRARVRL